MEEIKLKISPEGDIKIEVRGVDGPGCIELTQTLEKELGLVVRREKTSEFDVREREEVKTRTTDQVRSK